MGDREGPSCWGWHGLGVEEEEGKEVKERHETK